jgi:hypothetical protein
MAANAYFFRRVYIRAATMAADPMPTAVPIRMGLTLPSRGDFAAGVLTGAASVVASEGGGAVSSVMVLNIFPGIKSFVSRACPCPDNG